MLGVIIASDFSVSQHVQRLVTASAQTIYALRVLRSCSLSNAALQHVYRATVIARLTYATSAWRGFIKASNREAHQFGNWPCPPLRILRSGSAAVWWTMRRCGRWTFQQGSATVEPRPASTIATAVYCITTL